MPIQTAFGFTPVQSGENSTVKPGAAKPSELPGPHGESHAPDVLEQNLEFGTNAADIAADNIARHHRISRLAAVAPVPSAFSPVIVTASENPQGMPAAIFVDNDGSLPGNSNGHVASDLCDECRNSPAAITCTHRRPSAAGLAAMTEGEQVQFPAAHEFLMRIPRDSAGAACCLEFVVPPSFRAIALPTTGAS